MAGGHFEKEPIFGRILTLRPFFGLFTQRKVINRITSGDMVFMNIPPDRIFRIFDWLELENYAT